MKRYFVIFSAALAALVSCHKEPNQEPVPEPQVESHEVTIEAGIHSKTMLDGNAVKWEGSDKIALVFTHSTSAPHVNKTFVNQEAEEPTDCATFKGKIPNNVSLADGYDDLGYAVYPETAITDEGVFRHNLPATQVAKANGSFPSGCNLSSAALALSEMGEGGSTKTDFRNALSILRIALSSDVKSVTVTGTAPLAGTAPLQMYYNSADDKDADNGRLLVDASFSWSDPSNSVTLVPANETLFEDMTYNILVWPGKQEGLTITLNFNNLGQYEKASSISTTNPVTFKPAKFYNLNVKNTEELVIEEITGRLDHIEDNLPDLDENVRGLLNQIQSVSLMTEYLDNAVYAQTNSFNNGVQHMDVVLDYIVKPESAAQALVEAFNADPSVAKGVLAYKKSTGYEDAGELAVNNLVLSDAPFGKYVTASVSAANISSDFYDGKFGASLALLVKSGETEILSDFANLVPKSAGGITGSYLNDIPAIPGARVVIPFSYAVSDPSVSYTLTVGGTEKVDEATVTYDRGTRTGNLTVQISEEHKIKDQTVTLVLTVGEGASQEVISQTFTFADSGSEIKFVDPGQIDWIGGEYTIDLETTNINTQMLSCSGAGVSQSGGNVFVFDENTGAERTVEIMCTATIPIGSLNYYKILTLTQTANGTDLSREYYSNGKKVELNKATAACANYFNIVILGDGYKKRDLLVGGRFEKRARSAMDSFFAIEPYTTFKNRFNVYMVAYESKEEGTDIRSSGISKDTYFNSYCIGGGNTVAYADVDKVTNVVKYAVGSDDEVYYRSIAILLINTDEQAGSTGYPFQGYKSGWPNGYASFAIAALAANSTGTNGLIKHEAGGHAFGRLADEYYSSDTASSSKKDELNNWHAKGWYWNVNPKNSGNYYKFTNSDYSSEVGYIEGAWGYQYGIYRPTLGGMMQNNTGVFNAPSRHAIYHRIITESEGASAYSWQKFLDYDKRNR